MAVVVIRTRSSNGIVAVILNLSAALFALCFRQDQLTVDMGHMSSARIGSDIFGQFLGTYSMESCEVFWYRNSPLK